MGAVLYTSRPPSGNAMSRTFWRKIHSDSQIFEKFGRRSAAAITEPICIRSRPLGGNSPAVSGATGAGNNSRWYSTSFRRRRCDRPRAHCVSFEALRVQRDLRRRRALSLDGRVSVRSLARTACVLGRGALCSSRYLARPAAPGLWSRLSHTSSYSLRNSLNARRGRAAQI